ncbi:putative membrane protein [Actinoalloteichus sp. GBA129-24]|uniref:Membrane protein n=1 Tax=Actinoalloteichus fjordicus TaxID=1612552 RepID=A0AAC9LF77_9PSEU|nr:putative membrane protein [Actinoalloteichus fjordicus]APU22346.1 putative membrane protein [Actinoalloteichus sp. GBA129-24]
MEIIPGVSGGTVALVTGLYERLIASAGHLVTMMRLLVSGLRRRDFAPMKAEAAKADWALLGAVLAGMAIAVVTVARLLTPILDDYPVESRAVFIGMVAASILVPVRMMGGLRRPLHWVLLIGTAVAALLLTGLPYGAFEDPPLWLVGIVAAFAVCALVLPGLSGSFLMMVVGLYEPTLDALNARDLTYIGVFMLGAVIGLGTFVKVLQWLLEHRRRATLAVMTGLMIGSLRALWPWQDADSAAQSPDGDLIPVLLLALAGAGVVLVLVFAEQQVAAKRAAEAAEQAGADAAVSPNEETMRIPRTSGDEPTERIRR